MPISHGRYSKGYYKGEETKNSNPGSAFLWIGTVRRFIKTINPNLIDVRGTGSNKRKFSPKGQAEFDFGVEYYIQDLGLIDQVLTPTSTAGTYTCEIRDSGDGSTYKYWLFTGIVLDTVSVSSRVGEMSMATVTGPAMNLTVTGSTGISDPADTTTTPYVWYDGSVKVGASNAPEIIEYTVDVKNNAARRYGFTNEKPRDNLPNDFDVTGSCTFTVEGSTYVGDLLNDTEQDLIFYLNSTTSYITVSSAKFSRLDQPSVANEVLTEVLAFEGKDAVVTEP